MRDRAGDVDPVRRVGRIVIGVGTVLLFFKLGGISSPGWGLPSPRPWTWRPGPLFRDTLTTGGDTGAHVWTSSYVKRDLASALRPTGWSKDWYAGFPVLHFYFPAPTWAIVALSTIVPINIAFKWVSVSGLFGLPFAAMYFARAAKLSEVHRYLFGLAGFLFIAIAHYEILGGNIISTMAGEFSFTISLALGLVFLGLLMRVWRDGQRRVLAPIVLALAGTSHILPTMFIAVASLAVICTHIDEGMRPLRTKVRDLLGVVAAAALLAAFWVVPFAADLPYSHDMGWERTTTYVSGLFPGLDPTPLSDAPKTGAATTTVAVFFAIFGGLWAASSFLRSLWSARLRPLEASVIGGHARQIRAEARVGCALTIMALASAAAFRFAPQFRLWNERALPFYYLSVYLLAGVGFVVLGRLLRLHRRRAGSVAVLSVVALWSIGAPIRLLPSWTPLPKWQDGQLSFQKAGSSKNFSSIDDWPAYNYNGYEDQDEWPEFKAVIGVMDRIGRERGCGRAMWEYEDELDRYGTSMGMMLLPHFTKGCVGSMEGLYFESSATTPYHFLNASLLSARASDPQRGLPYRGINIGVGVQKMQQFGVRYYMAFSPAALAEARVHPDLTLLATSEYSRDCTEEENNAKTCPTVWEIYEVAKAEIVEGLAYQPTVVTGIGQSQTSGWLSVAVAQFDAPTAFPVPLAANGPPQWSRSAVTVPTDVETVGEGVTIAAPTPLLQPRVVVSEISEGQDRVRFRVDRVGIPVVVKVSYFPNWMVTGAEGPWRLAPNFMVVIPTSTNVELFYSRSRAEKSGLALSGVGVVALALSTVVGLRRRNRTLRGGELPTESGPG